MKIDSKGRFVKQPELERFWDKVKKTDSCWIWIGAKANNGYGALHRSGNHSKIIRAHRLSWEVHFGPIPEGLEVLHRCDNPPCVRPDHLHLGTQADNHKDRVAHGIRLLGEKNPMAKLSPATIEAIRSEYIPRTSGCPKGYDPQQGPLVGSQQYLAQKFGLRRSTIYKIVKRQRWNHL